MLRGNRGKDAKSKKNENAYTGKGEKMSQQPSKNEGKDWAELKLDRVTTTNTICSNLVSAGVLQLSEVDRYKAVLQTYDPIMLIKVLLVSREHKAAHEEA